MPSKASAQRSSPTKRSDTRQRPQPIQRQAARSGSQPNPADMQKRLGNQGTQAWLAEQRIQPKLTVGQPGDQYEQEADRTADAVMRMPEPAASSGDDESKSQAKSRSNVLQRSSITPIAETRPIQRLCAECEKEIEGESESKQVQTKENNGQKPQINPDIEKNINALDGKGSPLPDSTRNYFEPRFGANFSQVRVHIGTQSAETAKALNAKAFTTGNNIFFGQGQFTPNSNEGQKLIGHELTHVVQQTGSDRVRAGESSGNRGLSVQKSIKGSDPILSMHADVDDRTDHGQTEGVTPDLGVAVQPKAITSLSGDAAEDEARAVETAMEVESPSELDIHAMSRESIQRSAGDDEDAIKQKLKDAIDKAFLARDTWKANDNIGQAIYSERLGLLLGRKSADKFASMQELDAYIAESDKAALTELDTMAKLGLDHVDLFPHVFPLTWAAKIRNALWLEVDLESLKKRLEADSTYADSLAKRVPTSLFWSGLARTYEEALKGEAPFKLELRHAEWHKAHVTRDYALGWIEYARSQALVSFYEFWQRIVQSLSDDISSGKIKIDQTFQESYKDFLATKRATLPAIPGKIRAFGPSQPELSGDQIINDVESVALVMNNIASLASLLTFIPIWSKAETEHAAKVTENDASIASLDPNGRVIQAMLWAYEGDYFSEAGKHVWQAIKAGAKENAAEMVGAMIGQMIPYVNVAVDFYFLSQGVKGIDAGLKGLQAAFVSASNATTTVDLQRESAKLALAITGQGASLILSLLAVIGAVSSLRAKAAKIKAENPKMSDEEAMNKALKDTQSKEAAALREARKKKPVTEEPPSTSLKVKGGARQLTVADMLAYEQQGGHTLARHGAAHSRQSLKLRTIGETNLPAPRNLPGGTRTTDFRIWQGKKQSAASKWKDDNTMCRTISDLINRNLVQIEKTTKAGGDFVLEEIPVGQVVGEGWMKAGGATPEQTGIFWKEDLQHVTVVIKPDGQGGFYVLTAYPN
jgi:hypothetical protein